MANPIHIVQIANGDRRAVAIVEAAELHLIDGYLSTYELALGAIRSRRSVAELALQSGRLQTIAYDNVYRGESDWRVLPPLDHPEDPAHLLVSGTGLTHKVSVENRAAMHQHATADVTDSMRMYQMGKEGGRPSAGQIGVQPEWFYKGDGSILKAHMEPLTVPSYADDGGEEPEIAGAYVIGDDGQPFRLGFMVGNEFSDHIMEKQNYLYLATSKLRSCSVGPELVVADSESFSNLSGTVAIERQGATVWKADIYSGESNMCHSLANLEHHHFKYGAHRRPGDVHIHFFGADAFSFGENLLLQDGDIMEVSFPAFGRALRNPLQISSKDQTPVSVRTLT